MRSEDFIHFAISLCRQHRPVVRISVHRDLSFIVCSALQWLYCKTSLPETCQVFFVTTRTFERSFNFYVDVVSIQNSVRKRTFVCHLIWGFLLSLTLRRHLFRKFGFRTSDKTETPPPKTPAPPSPNHPRCSAWPSTSTATSSATAVGRLKALPRCPCSRTSRCAERGKKAQSAQFVC